MIEALNRECFCISLDGQALARLGREVFGDEFVAIYGGVKRGEFETFMQVISPWEREYLLMNV